MKKIFENPTMEISLFCMENVVTASGAETTNVDAAKEALSKGANVTEITFDSIRFTL